MLPKQDLLGWLELWFARLTSSARRRRSRRGWNRKWAREDFARPWLRRGVSKEIVDAVEEGWFPQGATAIDLGCGEGDVAAWLAERGFQVLGIDIAPAAIHRARARFGGASGRLQFQAHDLCEGPPPGGPFDVLVDRGCFHQIALEDRVCYGNQVMKAAASDARLLLFHKAFRNGTSPGDRTERQRVTDMVHKAFGDGFVIEKCEETFLDPDRGSNPERVLPGLVYWMRRRSNETSGVSG